jgi:hypothetical protein
MIELCTDELPWSRRLWRLGTILEISELLEASAARQEGTLGEAAVKYLGASLVGRARRDPGLGSAPQRGQLIGHLNRTLIPGGHDYLALEQLQVAAENTYLTHWAQALRQQPFPVESVARALIAHLLDRGFSTVALHKWLTYWVKFSPQQIELADLFEEAHGLDARPRVRYEALVPVAAAPDLSPGLGKDWLAAPETSAWLDAWLPGVIKPRQVGALVLCVDARDPYSALTHVRAVVERVSARFRVGARRELTFTGAVYLQGEPDPLDLAPRPRRVRVYALHRTEAIFDLQLPRELDAALELLEPLDVGAPAAAVAGSWAALESLLVGPGDTANRVVAATRMARIVACSYFRAELTALANAFASSGKGGGVVDVRGLPTNHARARRLEEEMLSGRPMLWPRTRHQLARDRMLAALADPGAHLTRVCQQLEDGFRRLYRQRNFVVHAGRTSSVALDGCLRTMAPLVGEGIERVVHAATVLEHNPLQLAAAAELAIGRAQHGPVMLADLLPYRD